MKSSSASTVCCPGLENLLDPEFFSALGDPNRIRILIQLARCRKPCTVTELSGCCPVDFSGVSRHLRILHRAGIVSSQRKGKQVYYSAKIVDLLRTFRSMAEELEDSIRQSSQDSTFQPGVTDERS